jgi:hypothetical protein
VQRKCTFQGSRLECIFLESRVSGRASQSSRRCRLSMGGPFEPHGSCTVSDVTGIAFGTGAFQSLETFWTCLARVASRHHVYRFSLGRRSWRSLFCVGLWTKGTWYWVEQASHQRGYLRAFFPSHNKLVIGTCFHKVPFILALKIQFSGQTLFPHRHGARWDNFPTLHTHADQWTAYDQVV